jgi:hypothetical protein
MSMPTFLFPMPMPTWNHWPHSRPPPPQTPPCRSAWAAQGHWNPSRHHPPTPLPCPAVIRVHLRHNPRGGWGRWRRGSSPLLAFVAPRPTGTHVTPRVTKTLKKVINKWLGAVTSLNQKTEFKNKVSDSNYCEINPNFLFEWNSKFWSSFDGNLFFLTLRCNQELASQISSKSKVLEIFSEFLSKFNS